MDFKIYIKKIHCLFIFHLYIFWFKIRNKCERHLLVIYNHDLTDKIKWSQWVVRCTTEGCAHVYLKLTDVCVQLRAQWIRHQCRVFQPERCQRQRRCSMRPARSRIQSWISRIRVSQHSKRCQDCVSPPYSHELCSVRQIRQLVLTGFSERMKIRGHLLLAHEVGVFTHAHKIILNNLKKDTIVNINCFHMYIFKCSN